MINKLKLLFGVALLLPLGVVSAQTTTTNNGETIAGSPYVDDKYKDGVIYYGDKNYIVPIRYNAYQDLIEYKQNGKPLVLEASASIEKVVFGDDTFIPLNYGSSGKKLGYFAVLDSGKMTLYAKKKIIFVPFKKGGKLDGTDQPAEFKKAPDVFYYQLGDGPLQEVDNVKSWIAGLPDKQDELTQYAKKEKISTKKEKDIIQFVKHYNSL